MSPDKLSLVNAAGDTSSAGLGDVNAAFLADVPIVAIGILGFAVAKLLFAFRGLTRPSVLVLLSIFAAFLAVTFDLFRIFQTDNNPRDQTTRVLLILRELFLAVALFVRYLFFLEYASRWPDRARSERWPVTRVILEVFLLLVAVVMFVLQLVWRYNSRLPAVYTADVVLELCWTTLVMLKMGSSIIFFPDPSQRWRFAKLVLPIMGALLIEWGISVGNAVMHNFADCSAGRFLQAVEVYIILLSLTGITISRLIVQGPPSSLSLESTSPSAEKGPGGRFVISKPILPVGLPKFSFLATPRRAPRPPEEEQAAGPSRSGLSSWLASRAAPAVPQQDIEQQLPAPPALSAYDQDAPMRVDTPEIEGWRNKPRLVTHENEQPSATNALAMLGPRVFDLGLSEIRASRFGMPPPTPPPQGPLPLPPVPQSRSPTPTMSVRDSGVDMDSPVNSPKQRPVSSTFGHITTAEPSASTSRSATTTDVSAERANRRSSAPTISITPASDSASQRAARALSNPGGGAMQQSIEALLREQDELERMYPSPSPNPRRSRMSGMSGTTVISAEEESRESGPTSTARESSRSDFSLSRFPAPPASSFRRAIAPLRSRFSTESSASSDGRLRPPTLTVQTDMRRIRRAMQSSSQERSSGMTQWDVTSFIGGLTNSDGSSPPDVPPPSTAPMTGEHGPTSTISLSPSPKLPRPPPRVRRNRPIDSFAELENTLAASEGEDEDGPVQTRKATRATRVSRVRFVEQPRRPAGTHLRAQSLSGPLFFNPSASTPAPEQSRTKRLSISGPMPLGTVPIPAQSLRGSVGGVGRGAPALGRGLPAFPRPRPQ